MMKRKLDRHRTIQEARTAYAEHSPSASSGLDGDDDDLTLVEGARKKPRITIDLSD